MTQANPEDLERQLERDRAEIGATIDAIQQRLSPGQMLDHVLGYARSGGKEAAVTLTRSARQNPWPLILTGIGLAWLMQSTAAARNGGAERPGYGEHELDEEDAALAGALERARHATDRLRRQAGETEEAFQARVTEAKAHALELRANAGESAAAFRQRVEGYMDRAQARTAAMRERTRSAVSRGAGAVGNAAHGVQAGAQGAQERARTLYDSEPLLAGVIGVVAGTLIGALLPSTEAENRVMGSQGEQVRKKASETASEVAGRATAAAAEGTRAAAHAVEETARGGGGSRPAAGAQSRQG